MWNTLFVEPVLNLLILIQSFMPGNDLGLAILVFTILVRILMWPLIKKQIHQTRIMQKVTPEINAIRKKAKGSKDRATIERVNKETMAVYKKHGISPFSSIGTLVIQLPLFIAIYSAVKVAFEGSANLSNMLYSSVKNLSYVEDVLNGSSKAVTTFADWADLALKPFANNKVYVPVLIIALVSIVLQYFQVKQTMPKNKKNNIEDPNEKLANATPYIMVVLFGWISLSVAGAISFYLGAGALVAIFQQYYLMDIEKKEAILEESKKPVIKVTTNAEEVKKQKSNKLQRAQKNTKPKKKAPSRKKSSKNKKK
ncbi:MAG: YidC/Oxa1 family membrane protein insertase [Candidatus Nomurabacteria bacterium]|nr:MAG: YidC/Oxa1 family membrane protein insertase [Candidatus Nomurabacteria bacterium]HRV76090.1 YidC/Oxa1 family membrane protein insertase [Candidatus Saccharimonadales bacterium]